MTKLHYVGATPDETTIDKLDHALFVLPCTTDRPTRKTWRSLPYGALLEQRFAQRGGKKDAPFVTELPNPRGTRVVVAVANAKGTAFDRLSLARKLSAACLQAQPRRVDIVVGAGAATVQQDFAEALALALLVANHQLPDFKSEATTRKALAAITVRGVRSTGSTRTVLTEAEANNLARTLISLPPNELNPATYRRRAQALARQNGWSFRFYNKAALRRLGAGAFLAVAQGSEDNTAGIVRLSYRPRGQEASSRPRLALVGKGICFDTGGNNLKPARHMHGMHEDMGGSAVALATLLALSQRKVDYGVDCWLALSENHIGPKAYKPNDVVKACNGKTIEVIHTDAEGRMVLADTLALACRQSPSLVIDYATLTGACIYALGTAYTGAFTNREALQPVLIAAGRDSGERVWPFPLDSDYDQALESKVADIKQCTLEGEADHILAARFLSRFVDESSAWIHLDLAACNHKGGLAHVPTDVTGFGVRFSLELLGRANVFDHL
ncbi:MAG: hypothetical protein AMS22_01165 [Thiotrichales bacterium SG8_50]|nr:MAG: hypothetical protein AMS22_01165 [Thiotrichales bacterium SG8_50]